MSNFKQNEIVKIDVAHAEIIKGLVLSQKPQNILELGFGGGRSCDAIISAINYNKNNAKFTIVDNWIDWNGNMPEQIKPMYEKYAKIITMNEKDFVFSTKEKYDFIMSDADHHHTNEWFEYVYDELLNENGILIYHDINLITEDFINLREIYTTCKKRKLNYYLFNKSTLFYERCYRGLLVIFKNI